MSNTHTEKSKVFAQDQGRLVCKKDVMDFEKEQLTSVPMILPSLIIDSNKI